MQRQGTMLSRSIAVMACLSLIGMTILPASVIPCCCKNKDNLAQGTFAHPLSCCEKSSAVRTATAGIVKPCCAKNSVDLQSCCSNRVVLPECLGCRCLEQMQIIALSGYSVDESTVRIPLLSIPDMASTSDLTSRIAANPTRDEGPPGNPAFLRTCTLRC